MSRGVCLIYGNARGVRGSRDEWWLFLLLFCGGLGSHNKAGWFWLPIKWNKRVWVLVRIIRVCLVAQWIPTIFWNAHVLKLEPRALLWKGTFKYKKFIITLIFCFYQTIVATFDFSLGCQKSTLIKRKKKKFLDQVYWFQIMKSMKKGKIVWRLNV